MKFLIIIAVIFLAFVILFVTRNKSVNNFGQSSYPISPGLKCGIEGGTYVGKAIGDSIEYICIKEGGETK